MCLYIGDNNSFIAKKDIVVYKSLNQKIDGTYESPFQREPVFLDNIMFPKEKAIETPYGFKRCIEGGVIYAYTHSFAFYNPPFKAIIPKGVKFWLQDDLYEIAAENLYITSQTSVNEISDLYDCLICGADVLLDDGGRYKLTDYFDPNRVIGIFVYKNQVMSVNYAELGLIRYTQKESRVDFDDRLRKISTKSPNTAVRSMSGYKNTQILKDVVEDNEDFESDALEFCKQLGDNWYIPSLGQIKRLTENLLKVNLTLRYLGRIPLKLNRFWSSTLGPKGYAWDILGTGDSIMGMYENDYLDCKHYITPFLKL